MADRLLYANFLTGEYEVNGFPADISDIVVQDPSMGGDLIASSLTNLYYPESNRGPGIVFSSFFINSGGRIANALVQEFLLRKYTRHSDKGD